MIKNLITDIMEGKQSSVEKQLKNKADKIKGKEGKDTKISDIDKINVEEYTLPSKVEGEGERRLVDLLDNMESALLGDKGRIILSGDVGTGKTSFIKQFANIVGLPLIMIEAPHLVEEHLVNLPFLVQIGKKEKHKYTTYDKNIAKGYDVKLSTSYLARMLKEAKPLSDKEIQDALTPTGKRLRDKYEDIINELVNNKDVDKSKYTVILFIDEFYRTSSPKMKNLLRQLLNKRMGVDKIDSSVYFVYASNIASNESDNGSIDDIPLNYQMLDMEFFAPSKDEFSQYILDKYTKNGKEVNGKLVTKNKDDNEMSALVFNSFYKHLKDEDFGFNDDTVEGEGAVVRMSPRRVEQMMVYIENNRPIKTDQQARALMKYIETNLQNYITLDVSSRVKPFMKILKDIAKNDGVDITKLTPLQDNEWEIMLDNSIDTQLKARNNRQYTVSLAGLPGAAKTWTVDRLATERGMNLISFEISQLNKDDVIGVPTPETKDDDTIETKFTAPPLYNLIMDNYNKYVKLHPERSIKKSKAAYNHILFVDEITRPQDESVFNSIRKLLLERKVNDQFPLPEDIMIISAMNPRDVGVTPLTSHTKDVIDVIQVGTDFNKTLDFLGRTITKGHFKTLPIEFGFNLPKLCLDLIEEIATRFKSSYDHNGDNISNISQPHFWDINGVTVYISPREIESLFIGTVVAAKKALQSKEKDGIPYDVSENYTDKEFNFIIDKVKTRIIRRWRQNTLFITRKQDVDDNAFKLWWDIVQEVIRNSSVFKDIRNVTSNQVLSFNDILKNVKYKIEKLDTPEGITKLNAYFQLLIDTRNTDEFQVDYAAIFHGKEIQDMPTADTFIYLYDTIRLLRKVKTFISNVSLTDITSRLLIVLFLEILKPLSTKTRIDLLKTVKSHDTSVMEFFKSLNTLLHERNSTKFDKIASQLFK